MSARVNEVVFEYLMNVLRSGIEKNDVQYHLVNAAGQVVKMGKFETISSVTFSSDQRAVYFTCTLRDTSADEYTFRYVEVYCVLDTSTYIVGRYDFGTDVTKGANQTLKVDIDIRVKGVESVFIP
jgi:hypothetical protein